jgi:hypothetical protein
MLPSEIWCRDEAPIGQKHRIVRQCRAWPAAKPQLAAGSMGSISLGGRSVGERLSVAGLLQSSPAARPELHRPGLALDLFVPKAAVEPATQTSASLSAIEVNANVWSGGDNTRRHHQ